MAYPTVSGPSGLVPVKLVSGVPFVGVTRQYSIASGYNTNIFNGDAVKLVTGGTVERDTADAAMTPMGVFLGCTYTDPTLGYQLFSQHYPANTVASDIMAYVADGTDVLFKVAVLSSGAGATPVIGDLAITDLGANVAMINNDWRYCYWKFTMWYFRHDRYNEHFTFAYCGTRRGNQKLIRWVH